MSRQKFISFFFLVLPDLCSLPSWNVSLLKERQQPSHDFYLFLSLWTFCSLCFMIPMILNFQQYLHSIGFGTKGLTGKHIWSKTILSGRISDSKCNKQILLWICLGNSLTNNYPDTLVNLLTSTFYGTQSSKPYKRDPSIEWKTWHLTS